ncbi:hypothetical protein BBJ28_00019914 [Nothophytophthora sp. Chile5]|nr:hypothetical protein BBJ28_00019914 [Nothophytophthora sp. Chile5]
MGLNEKTRLLPAVQAIYGSTSNRLKLKRCLIVSALVAAVALVGAAVWWGFFHDHEPAVVDFICGNTKNEAGYIKLPNKVDDNYFYWYFEAQHNASTAPLVIWLTGGPGGSSLLALFTENGPCRIQPDLSTEIHPHSWTYEANMIWLDQPTSVGFSYSSGDDHDFNEADVGENLYWFLQGFIEKHPEFDGREFFLTGESYGGHYVPGAAHYIWQHNKRNDSIVGETKHINLQGIAIGNGWTNPVVQVRNIIIDRTRSLRCEVKLMLSVCFIQFTHAVDMTDNVYNITLLDESAIEHMKINTGTCTGLTHACMATPTNATICGDAYMFCYENVTLNLAAEYTGRNPYDIRESCDWVDFGFCHGIPQVEAFLKQDTVLQYLKVDREWVGGSEEVSENFVVDYMQPFDDYVADLLDDNIRVLLYVGDADAMCNWSGNKAWIDALKWKNQDAFNAADEHAFMAFDPLDAAAAATYAGVARSFENLALVRVFNAGHMVPTHQPAVSLDLINRFFKNKEL